MVLKSPEESSLFLIKNAMLWNLCKLSYDFQNHTRRPVMAGADYQLNGIWNHLGVCVWRWGIKLIKLTGVGGPSYKWVAPFLGLGPGQHRKGDSSTTPVFITPCFLTMKMRWPAASSFCCLVFSTHAGLYHQAASQTNPSFLSEVAAVRVTQQQENKPDKRQRNICT